MASGKLLVDEPADGVARIRISNPARRGALDHEILDALAEEVRGQDAHCLLLTGDGPVFSAGSMVYFFMVTASFTPGS